MTGLPQKSLHYVFGGSMPSGERFAWGLWADGSALTMDVLTINKLVGLAAAAAATTVIGTGVRAGFPAGLIYEKCDLYYYGLGGTASTMQATQTIGQAGTGTAAAVPDQLALVATLRTAIPGRSYRGRAYLPAPNSAQLAGTTGLFGDTFVAGYNTAMATLLTDIKTGESGTSTPGVPPVVVSRKLGIMTPITAVEMDNRADVQRSRANRTTGVVRATHAV